MIPRRHRHRDSAAPPLLAFVRTPKGTLLAVLLALFAVGSTREARLPLVPATAASLVLAAGVDALVLRWQRRRWLVPVGGCLTALLVTMVVSPLDPWYVAPLATGLGLASKHAVRWRGTNVLNPAAVGLIASYSLADAAHSWWGALAELPPLVGWPLLLGGGAVVVDRVQRAPSVLAFLLSHLLLFTIVAYVGDPAAVAEIFVAPDLPAAVFFATVMVSDPPTSPVPARLQVLYGAIVATVSFGLFMTIGAAYFLLGGVIAGNLWTVLANHWRGRRPPP